MYQPDEQPDKTFAGDQDYPARRRDRRLAQTRRLSAYVVAGAAAASIGLGGMFAHDLPGHQHLVASSAQSRTGKPGAGTPSAQPGGASPAASRPAARPQLSQPAQPPAPAPPAPPHTTSGGS